MKNEVLYIVQNFKSSCHNR